MGQHAAESFDDLRARVVALVPTMSVAEARVARLLIEDPGAASRMTINELADATGSSDSTVVRTARTLGFRGYPALRLALAAAAAGQPVGSGATEPIAGDISPDDALATVVAKLAAAEGEALRSTVFQLDVAVLGRVVEAIAQARLVDLYGVGISGLVTQDLWYKFMRIGLMSHAHTEFHHAMASASLLGPGDVAVAISQSGQITDVIDPLRGAADRGATTVAITSHPRSPLARLAQHTLLTAAREEALRPGAMASRTSQLLVCDAIFVGVAQLSYDSSLRNIQRTSESVESRRQRTKNVRQ